MQLFITKYSKIEDHKLSVNGQETFSSDEQQVGKVFKSIYKHLDLKYPKYHKMDKLCKLGFLAAETIFQDQAITQKYLPEEIAVVLSNSDSTINIDSQYQNSIQNKNDYFPSPSLFVYTLPNIVIGEIAIRNGLKGEIGFLISEKFSAKTLKNYVENIFKEEGTKACLTGWVNIDERNRYKSVLFLIEKADNSQDNITFDAENLETLFN